MSEENRMLVFHEWKTKQLELDDFLLQPKDWYHQEYGRYCDKFRGNPATEPKPSKPAPPKVLPGSIPTKVSQLEKKLPIFIAFLESRGAEMLATTSQWEVLRFRAGTQLAVLYTNTAGDLKASGTGLKALTAYWLGKPWSAGVAVPRKGKNNSRHIDVGTLLARDGPNCFLCDEPLGPDLTIEHLLALNVGGPDHISNKALAHLKCNTLLGHKSLMEKIKMREAQRKKHDGKDDSRNDGGHSPPPPIHPAPLASGRY